LKILSDFGAADVDWGTTLWHADQAAAIILRSADVSRAWYADLWFDLREWAVLW
jgi:hypothetical protein